MTTHPTDLHAAADTLARILTTAHAAQTESDRVGEAVNIMDAAYRDALPTLRAVHATIAAAAETTHGEGRHPDPDHGPGDVVRLFGHPVQLPEPADGEFVTDVAVVIRATYTDRDSGDGVAFTCTDQTGGVLLTGILVTAADLVRRGDE